MRSVAIALVGCVVTAAVALAQGVTDPQIAAIVVIDKTLIPSSKNAELKALLTKVRPAIAAHLQHAKSLQALLKK